MTFAFLEGAFFAGRLAGFEDPLAFPFTATLAFGLRPRLTGSSGTTTAGAFRAWEAFPSAGIATFGLRPRFAGVGEIAIGFTGATCGLLSFCATLGGLPRFFGTMISALAGAFDLDFGTGALTLRATEDLPTRSGLGFRRVRARMIVGKGIASSSNPSN